MFKDRPRLPHTKIMTMSKHSMSKLTARQQAFVQEYLIDLNAAQAAVRAGYSPKGSKTHGCRLLNKNTAVQEAVKEAMQQRGKRTQISQDRILDELSRIAFGDLRDAVAWGPGGIVLTDSAALTSEQVAALAEISETAKGLLKVKRHDKVRALELLMRHLGMLSEKVNASAEPDLNILEAARARAGTE